MKVTLAGIRPPVWRRIVVAGDATLAELHDVIQVVMGWEDAHLHSFEIGKRRYGSADHGLDAGEVDESTRTVAAAFARTRQGVYVYDFGDSWEHRLSIEPGEAPAVFAGVALCTAGRRACPPEDCGGAAGYANLLAALADPSHEEHEEAVEWVGEDFDPDVFDLAAVNAELAELGRSHRNA